MDTNNKDVNDIIENTDLDLDEWSEWFDKIEGNDNWWSEVDSNLEEND